MESLMSAPDDADRYLRELETWLAKMQGRVRDDELAIAREALYGLRRAVEEMKRASATPP
jgi:hypothetical protein